MADFTALKTAIQQNIKQNGNEEITGNILQEVLLAMVQTLGDSAINDLATALANEVLARQNADGSLQGNIDAEALARGNADGLLSGRIGDEETARSNADTALQNAINTINTKLAEGYVYVGIATTSTNPSTPSGKVFYIAVAAGTYTNFLNSSSQPQELTQGINILKFNGTAWSVEQVWGVDDEPTANSNNIVKSGGVFDKVMTDGSAFDISAHFASGGLLATYADLSAAITALNTLSASYKRGGMSIKFVQSSDNTYIQARCMADSFTTDITKWQVVDAEPRRFSKNLVESGGVKEAINELTPKNTLEQGLYICDEQGNVLIRLDILDTKGGFGENLIQSIVEIVNNNALALQYTLEEGFFICDNQGKVAAEYKDGKWVLAGVNNNNLSNVAVKKGALSSGTTWTIQHNSVKNCKRLNFSAKITSFDSIILGHGKINGNGSNWIEVTSTNIIQHYVNNAGSEYTGYPITTAHGLTIENNIQLSIVTENSNTAKVILISSGNVFELNNIVWEGTNGDVYVTSTSSLTDASVGWTSSKLNSKLLLFGDSYFSLGDPKRWTTYLFQNGYTNFVLNGHGGEGSSAAYTDLLSLLSISIPKTIVWCIGMNDPDSENAVNTTWKNTLDNVMSVCKQNNIELILATIPTVVGGYNPDTQSYNLGIHKYKNAIVKASGYRYIDFAAAVGANETTGEWFNNGEADDMLEGYGQQRGRIHPTEYGAKALYMQAIADVPELTM